MNYNYYLVNNFTINTYTLSQSAGRVVILGLDGSINTFNTTHIQSRYDLITQYVCDLCVTNNISPVGYIFTAQYDNYLVTCDNVDYWVIQDYADGGAEITSKEIGNNGNNQETLFSNLSNYNLYLTPSKYINTNPYAQYYAELYEDTCVFDFANTYYPSDSYYYRYQVKQFTSGTNNYYFYNPIITLDNEGGLKLSFGQPRVNNDRDGYYNGYYEGFNDGYNEGHLEGYNEGIALDSAKADAFNYISNAFVAVGNILQLEIIPHVTLGLCFSIPFVFVVITMIFKLVKK